jgi:hypothetical protein
MNCPQSQFSPKNILMNTRKCHICGEVSFAERLKLERVNADVRKVVSPL